MSDQRILILRVCASIFAIALLSALFAPIAISFVIVGMVPMSGSASIWQISPVVCMILALITMRFFYVTMRFPSRPWRGPFFVSGLVILVPCIVAVSWRFGFQVGVFPHPYGIAALLMAAASLLIGSWFADGRRFQFGLLTVLTWTCCFGLMGALLASLE